MMRILIDIPDEEVPNKQEIIDINIHFIAGEVCECNYPYIVIPKGHGRIIDESQVTGTFIWDNGYIECYAPTIIEADKESEE